MSNNQNFTFTLFDAVVAHLAGRQFLASANEVQDALLYADQFQQGKVDYATLAASSLEQRLAAIVADQNLVAVAAQQQVPLLPVVLGLTQFKTKIDWLNDYINFATTRLPSHLLYNENSDLDIDLSAPTELSLVNSELVTAKSTVTETSAADSPVFDFDDETEPEDDIATYVQALFQQALEHNLSAFKFDLTELSCGRQTLVRQQHLAHSVELLITRNEFNQHFGQWVMGEVALGVFQFNRVVTTQLTLLASDDEFKPTVIK